MCLGPEMHGHFQSTQQSNFNNFFAYPNPQHLPTPQRCNAIARHAA